MNSNLYRCGWCGNLTKQNGEPLSKPHRQKAIRIIENYGDYRTIKTNGWCCEDRMSRELL